MKKIITTLMVGVSLFTASSCNKDFLDKQPQDQFSEEAVWNDAALIQTFINNTYRGLGHGFNNVMFSTFSDESMAVWGPVVNVTKGLINASDINDWGAVLKDYDNCIGCQYCSYACPFHIPKYRKRQDIVTKCTLCYERVEEGLTPACVRTCPTDALQFGDRDELMQYAEERVKFLRVNGFPNATIYGKFELGGLNMLYVLTDSPDKFDLPVDPKVPGQIPFWQNWVQPYLGWLIPLALLGSATSFVTTRILANKHGEHGEGGHE